MRTAKFSALAVTSAMVVLSGSLLAGKASADIDWLSPAPPAAPVTIRVVQPRPVALTAKPRPASTPRPVTQPASRPVAKAAPAAKTAVATGNVEYGQASWDEDGPGHCAHREPMPKGTVIHVLDLDNGRSTSCVVNDHGPYVDGRVIDLDEHVFEQLAPHGQGIIWHVRISYVRIGW